MIRRHSTAAIVMHWFNAGCWILLTGSGFGMLANSAMQPIGEWWPRLWAGPMGASGLLVAHVWLGAVWLTAYGVYCLLRPRREVLPFLREIFQLSLRSDLAWCVRKGGWLVLGESGLRSLGLGHRLPPQGFYNAGQKLLAVVAVACGASLAASGILLAVARGLTGAEILVQWALLVHLVCAGVMAAALPVHVYMAAFAPGEGPALRSMLTGFVPESFVHHHNPLWHAELVRQGMVQKPEEQKQG